MAGLRAATLLGGAVAGAFPYIADAADRLLDYGICETVADENLCAHVEKMKCRRTEEERGHYKPTAFCPPSNCNIAELAGKLSERSPFIGCSVRLVLLREDGGRRVRTGRSVHSSMSAQEIEDQLRSLVEACDRFLTSQAAKTNNWFIETTTSSSDADQDSEKMLSFAIIKCVRGQCTAKEIQVLEYKLVGKDVEHASGAVGRIIAKVLDGNKDISTIEAEDEFRNIFVTGQTGAGKSTVCGVLNECKLETFQRNIGSTGTTSVRRAELCKDLIPYRIIDSPGLGDRHGGDPIILSELSKEARMRATISTHLHVYKHTPDRAGADASKMSMLYGRALGEGVVKRLCVVVTFTEKDSEGLEDTVDGWVEFLSREAGTPFNTARERVITLDLDNPTGKEAEDELWRVTALSSGFGSMDMYESVAEKQLMRKLAENPESELSLSLLTRMKHVHLMKWQTLIADDNGDRNPSVSQKENFVSIDTSFGKRIALNRNTKTYIFHCPSLEEAEKFAQIARKCSQSGVKGLHGLFLKMKDIPVRLDKGEREDRTTWFSTAGSVYFRLTNEEELSNIAKDYLHNNLGQQTELSYVDFETFIRDNYTRF